MKFIRLFAAILALLAVISVYGCFGGKKTSSVTSNDSQTESEITSDSTDSTVQTEVPIIAPVELYKIEIVTENIEAENYSAKLSYPAVTGYSSSEIEEKVNALVRSFTQAKLDYALAETGAYTHVTYNIESFDITFKNERFFSAVSRISISVEGESDTVKTAYGLNVDLKNSRIVEFGSIIKFDEFKKAFGNGHFGQVSGYEMLLEETTFDDIINPYTELYSIYPEFYVRSGANGAALGIIADTVPVLGYYAEFEADIKDDNYVNEYFFELTLDRAK